jgi:hypothetical protein
MNSQVIMLDYEDSLDQRDASYAETKISQARTTETEEPQRRGQLKKALLMWMVDVVERGKPSGHDFLQGTGELPVNVTYCIVFIGS